jgi:hypothetical protein
MCGQKRPGRVLHRRVWTHVGSALSPAPVQRKANDAYAEHAEHNRCQAYGEKCRITKHAASMAWRRVPVIGRSGELMPAQVRTGTLNVGHQHDRQ